MSDRWRLRDIAREAILNVFARGARLLPAVVLAALLGAGSVGVLSLEQRALLADIDELNAQGRGVINYGAASANRPASVERESCEALADTPGVEGAGLVVSVDPVNAEPLAVGATAQRASAKLFPELGSADVIVGSTFAQHEGPFRVSVHDQIFDATVAPDSREGTRLSFSLTFPLLPSDSLADRCMVILEPLVSAEEVSTSLAARLTAHGNPISGQEVLLTASDPLQQYLDRLSRFLPLVLGLAGGVFTAVITRARSSELAVYRLSGTSRVSLFKILTLENLAVAGAAGMSATLTAVALHGHLFSLATAASGGVALAGTWAIVSTVASIDLPLRRPTDLAKDR